jgi:hypothetical protein
MRTSMLWILLLLTASACDGDGPIICTTEARFGVNVSARDAVTNQLIPDGVFGAVQEGSYTDSLQVFRDIEGRIHSLAAAVEREGTYRVEVRAAGYQPWVRNNVVVTADRCHVTPVNLQANLTPDAP